MYFHLGYLAGILDIVCPELLIIPLCQTYSLSCISYPRNKQWDVPFQAHVGIYVYFSTPFMR